MHRPQNRPFVPRHPNANVGSHNPYQHRQPQQNQRFGFETQRFPSQRSRFPSQSSNSTSSGPRFHAPQNHLLPHPQTSQSTPFQPRPSFPNGFASTSNVARPRLPPRPMNQTRTQNQQSDPRNLGSALPFTVHRSPAASSWNGNRQSKPTFRNYGNQNNPQFRPQSGQAQVTNPFIRPAAASDFLPQNKNPVPPDSAFDDDDDSLFSQVIEADSPPTNATRPESADPFGDDLDDAACIDLVEELESQSQRAAVVQQTSTFVQLRLNALPTPYINMGSPSPQPSSSGYFAQNSTPGYSGNALRPPSSRSALPHPTQNYPMFNAPNRMTALPVRHSAPNCSSTSAQNSSASAHSRAPVANLPLGPVQQPGSQSAPVNNMDFNPQPFVTSKSVIPDALAAREGGTSPTGGVMIYNELPAGTQVPKIADKLPGFNEQAGLTWIYPTNVDIRDYQYNIAQKALFQNTLVSLPTGRGKTFIAAVVMYNFYRWYPKGKVLFLVPTKALVNQQDKACYGYMGVPQTDMIDLSGANPSTSREAVWRAKRVFFMTPQIAVNDLEKGFYEALEICCIVVDEAHKATGNHHYCQLVQKLGERNHRQFRVLALTATPGRNATKIQDVIDNLLIARNEFRNDESIDIVKYNQTRKVHTFIVQPDELLKKMCDDLTAVINTYLFDLKKRAPLFVQITPESKPYLLRTLRQSYSANAHQHPGVQVAVKLCMVLDALLRGMEMLYIYGVRPFYESLQNSVLCEDATNKIAASRLLKDDKFNSMIEWVRHLLGIDSNGTNEQKTSVDRPFVYTHPKMRRLEIIVLKHFEPPEVEVLGPSTSAGPAPKNSRIMIFTTFRSSVGDIVDMLKRHGPTVRVAEFIGQASTSRGKNAKKGLNRQQQSAVMESFRTGELNVIVSTCVGEEGLDIGEVDLIVNYDVLGSPIRALQRNGRTGRNKAGEIVQLLAAGREQQSRQKGNEDKKTLKKSMFDKANWTFYQENPLMVPAEFRARKLPVCVYEKLIMPPFDKELVSKGKSPRQRREVNDVEKWLRGDEGLKGGKKEKMKFLDAEENEEYFRSCDTTVEWGNQRTTWLYDPKTYSTISDQLRKRLPESMPLGPTATLSCKTGIVWQVLPQKVFALPHSSRSDGFVGLMAQMSDDRRQEAIADRGSHVDDELLDLYPEAARCGYIDEEKQIAPEILPPAKTVQVVAPKKKKTSAAASKVTDAEKHLFEDLESVVATVLAKKPLGVGSKFQQKRLTTLDTQMSNSQIMDVADEKEQNDDVESEGEKSVYGELPDIPEALDPDNPYFYEEEQDARYPEEVQQSKLKSRNRNKKQPSNSKFKPVVDDEQESDPKSTSVSPEKAFFRKVTIPASASHNSADQPPFEVTKGQAFVSLAAGLRMLNEDSRTSSLIVPDTPLSSKKINADGGIPNLSAKRRLIGDESGNKLDFDEPEVIQLNDNGEASSSPPYESAKKNQIFIDDTVFEPHLVLAEEPPRSHSTPFRGRAASHLTASPNVSPVPHQNCHLVIPETPDRDTKVVENETRMRSAGRLLVAADQQPGPSNVARKTVTTPKKSSGKKRKVGVREKQASTVVVLTDTDEPQALISELQTSKRNQLSFVTPTDGQNETEVSEILFKPGRKKKPVANFLSPSQEELQAAGVDLSTDVGDQSTSGFESEVKKPPAKRPNPPRERKPAAKKIKTRLRALDFIEDEAVESGENSSDDEENSEMDGSLADFVDYGQVTHDQTRMRAFHAENMMDPNTPDLATVMEQYKPRVIRTDNIFSQAFVQDEDYGNDSFVAYSDEESPVKKKKVLKKPPKVTVRKQATKPVTRKYGGFKPPRKLEKRYIEFGAGI